MTFQPGQRVVYMKSGQAPCFNTDWPATYIRETPRGRHTIRVDGQRRTKSVKAFALRAWNPEKAACDCTEGCEAESRVIDKRCRYGNDGGGIVSTLQEEVNHE